MRGFDSHQRLSRQIREVLAPPERVLLTWTGPPELSLIGRDDVREKLIRQFAARGLDPVLLFDSPQFTRRVVARGRHARHLLEKDLDEAGDAYWWAYDVVFANPSQDLVLVLLEHPDGTDFGLASWGVGSEDLLQEALSILGKPRNPGS